VVGVVGMIKNLDMVKKVLAGKVAGVKNGKETFHMVVQLAQVHMV
jgi:hypothetical protein